MLGQTHNPLLLQTEQQTAARVPAPLRQAYQNVVAAGNKFLYAPQTRALVMRQLSLPGDAAQVAGQGIAKLFGILLHQTQGQLNMQAAIPAMTTLLCEALDFMEQTGRTQVTADLLARATKEMSAALMQLLGVRPGQLPGLMPGS